MSNRTAIICVACASIASLLLSLMAWRMRKGSKEAPIAKVTVSEADEGEQYGGTVYSGIVTDAEGNAIEGAKLHILAYYRRFHAVSGADGRYEMAWDVSKVPESHRDIWIIARHEGKNVASATRVGPETQRQNITLLPGITATGTITDADGNAIEKGTVYFAFTAAKGYITSFADRSRFAADSRGAYSVPFIPAENRYRVTFGAEGYGTEEVFFHTDDAVNGLVELRPAVLHKADEIISGLVVGPDGKGVANVQVFRKSAGQPSGYEETDADGRFTLSVCKGEVTLSAVVRMDGTFFAGRAKVASGTEDVRIVLEPR